MLYVNEKFKVTKMMGKCKIKTSTLQEIKKVKNDFVCILIRLIVIKTGEVYEFTSINVFKSRFLDLCQTIMGGGCRSTDYGDDARSYFV